MDVAIIGAAGACGRQLAIHLLARSVLAPTARLQLVGHRGGAHEHELWGLRADARDAFADRAPTIELIDDPEAIDADVVVMLAGATIAADPKVANDRHELVAVNRQVFTSYADALARRVDPPLVIVQSNPVELGVSVFAEALGRSRVVGAGAWSDTLRFRREIADALGVRRPQVTAVALGQHGDNLVPCWSTLRVVGAPDVDVDGWVARQRGGRSLDQLPAEIAAAKAALLDRLQVDDVVGAHAGMRDLPVDVRFAVKPFFTHWTAGATTEIVTAYAVLDLVTGLAEGRATVAPLQVRLEGEMGLHGVAGVPVILTPAGWLDVVDPGLADDERAALATAVAAVDTVIG